MPIKIINDFVAISLAELCAKREQGYSVLKTPHIGNQHPSNLLCAALGIPLDMVSFTNGERDKNFHPHLRIEGGVGSRLYVPSVWTPFATTDCGRSAEDYHQSSVQAVFPRLTITTDLGLMKQAPELAEAVFATATKSVSRLWYRKVTEDGRVVKCEYETVSWDKIAPNIFRFSNDKAGFIVPNRANILFGLVWQSISSGRDTIYHLSGPDMVGYIGKQQHSLDLMYDALRASYPGLPEVLTVYIVPVAQCRLLTHRNRADDVDAVLDVIAWYEGLSADRRKDGRQALEAISAQYPEFSQSIAEAQYLSQYDLTAADELYVPTWLLDTPLSRIRAFYKVMC